MPAGRPTKLTPEAEGIILAAVRRGNYRGTAFALAGIHRNRVAEYEKRAEAGDEPYASFMEKLNTAEAQAEDELLQGIRNAQPGIPTVQGPDVWQTKAWMLERRFPQRWCARIKQAVQENVDALTTKLKADPELHRKVLDVLSASEGSAEAGPGPH